MVSREQTVEIVDNIVVVRAILDAEYVKKLVNDIFAIQCIDSSDDGFKELDSYLDTNYYIKGQRSGSVAINEYVLKIYNSSESFVNCDVACQISKHYSSRLHGRLCTPKLVAPIEKSSGFVATVKIPLSANFTVKNGLPLNDLSLKNLSYNNNNSYMVDHYITLVEYIPGRILKKEDVTHQTVFQLGKSAGVLGKTLKDFSHECQETFRLNYVWNSLCDSSILLNPYVEDISDDSLKSKFKEILNECDDLVFPKLKDLEKQWIHGDLNEHNIIIQDNQVAGFIDLCEACYAYAFIDVSVALSYLSILFPYDKIPELFKAFYDGYNSEYSLLNVDGETIYYFMMRRFILSIAFGHYQHKHIDPWNDYLLITCKDAIPVFHHLCKDEVKSQIINILDN